MPSGSRLAEALLAEMVASLNSSYEDNFDHYRFGRTTGLRASVGRVVRPMLRSLGLTRLEGLSPAREQAFREIADNLDGLESLYDLLTDDASRNLLTNLLCYRMLGHRRVRLPVHSGYWKTMRRIERLVTDPPVEFTLRQPHSRLRWCDLHPLGYPMRMHVSPSAVHHTYVSKQYDYRNESVRIGPRVGGTVIDGGGCWGDTALFFAHVVGSQGRVFTFEFVPANLDVLRINVRANPDLAPVIDVVERALWSESGRTMGYRDAGPSTRIRDADGQVSEVITQSIDDFVADRRLEHVDFIKMDIEGAEPDALRGARRTLERDRPSLAISVYHSIDDMVSIPAYLRDLGLGYRFFLGHHSIHVEETVLYAKV